MVIIGHFDFMIIMMFEWEEPHLVEGSLRNFNVSCSISVPANLVYG